MGFRELSKVMIGLSLLISAAAHSDILRVDDSVDFKNGDITIAKAFHSNMNCRIWQYIPGSITAAGTFAQNTGVRSAKFGGENLSVVTTALSLRAKPSISAQDLENLRAQIFKTLSNLQATDVCYKSVDNVSQIVLTPAMVLSQSVEEPTDDRNYFSKLAPAFGRGDGKSFFDPTNPTTVNYILDASDPATKDRLLGLQQDSDRESIKVGDIGFYVDGVTGHVDSSLSVSGTYTAEFDSYIADRGCTTGGDKVGLSGGVVSGAGGGAGTAGYSRQTKKCLTELVTNFKGGSSKVNILWDDSRSIYQIDGKDIRYMFCDEKNKCRDMSLSNFVHEEIMFGLVLTNFDTMMVRLQDSTYAIRLGRRGTVNTTFEFTSGYKMNLEGRLGFKIPVYVNRLDVNSFQFKKQFEEKAIVACAQTNYDNQVMQYSEYASTLPMPISQQCHAVKNTSN